MENVITVIFNVESEAYQAFSDLKHLISESCTVTQMGIVKKQNGRIQLCEGYDTGIDTTDDTQIGGLIGGLVGVLGGPLGVLLGGSVGLMIGGAVDAKDEQKNVSLLERVSSMLGEGDRAIVALAMERDETFLETRLKPYDVTIIRHDAAVVAQEVEDAQKLQKEMAKEAKEKLRRAKREEKKGEIEAKRAKIRADFEKFMKK